jgi:hypothetical protein
MPVVAEVDGVKIAFYASERQRAAEGRSAAVDSRGESATAGENRLRCVYESAVDPDFVPQSIVTGPVER